VAGGTLIVGDVHGCADELQALYELARPARVVSVGDLFTKGPDPVGVWRRIQAWGARAVRGNHETALLQDPDRARRLGLPPAALDWMALLPLVIELEDLGLVVVHGGLHPELGIEGTDRRLATTLRRWPDERDPAAPFWWQLYQGPELVVYGHDAVRGLQDHRPRTLGLDTGCVYGGRLTGYIPEDGALVSVPAARVYKRPAGGR
jgi:diadenosine tetraphosphatase ApaH/serine/threonine PP2A family protein phosphatase